ncbi:hypothetical protein K435DRAFT_773290 [Dendrothele bispora CBS 962.96]|uniref:Pyridoxal phosphate homeostasis protein n=1 Tax=Dendrothele bispora (strain CBS 962.96) TaxID=1314807 RepID=A0A4S8MV70_DENBC|nr:hypothetical protein K435DRAFT_773290 [Dendrothele bispora CBS 962.96]
MSDSSFPRASTERTQELRENLKEIRQRVQDASASVSSGTPTKLVAVSKYKPSSDIMVCYEDGQRDFGENYVQELVDKGKELPLEIRWHFIGTLQSNKAKILAAIPNLHTIQTLSSKKAATALNKALAASSSNNNARTSPLNVLIQINTSGEDAKSGLPPLSSSSLISNPNLVAESDLGKLAKHVILNCPHLHFQGLMTIGSLELSLTASETEKNADFERLKETRDLLQEWLRASASGEEEEFTGVQGGDNKAKWGSEEHGGNLVMSMGMSSDFEAALKAGSDIVRVGTGIFGQRKMKEEVKAERTQAMALA